MRELLFRGKRTDNGKWVYGDLVHIENKTYISYYYESKLTTFINDVIEHSGVSIVGVAPFIEVDPNTICQYTGLVDRYDKKIFENDIVFWTEPVSMGYRELKGKVVYKTQGFVIDCGKFVLTLSGGITKPDFYVIGNTYDNPELIGE